MKSNDAIIVSGSNTKSLEDEIKLANVSCQKILKFINEDTKYRPENQVTPTTPIFLLKDKQKEL